LDKTILMVKCIFAIENRNMKRAINIFWAAILTFSAFSQTNISGKVVNQKGEPIIGANIYIKNSFDGCSSDLNGEFNFKTTAKDSVVLIVSYISYITVEKELFLDGTSVNLEIKLKEDAKVLGAVTISAGMFEAGDQKKTEILSSLDIVTTAGAGADVVSALRTLPGTMKVGNQTGLYVRGGDGREAATFIDGMKVQNPFYTAVPDISQRGRFDPFLFQGTYFSTGGYSAEYGQALSSALVLNTIGLPDGTFSSISLMNIGGAGGYNKNWEKGSLGAFANVYDLTPSVKMMDQNIDWIDPVFATDFSVMARKIIGENGILKAYSKFDYNHSAFNAINQMTLDYNRELELSNTNLFNIVTYQQGLGNKWLMNMGMSYSFNNDDFTFNDSFDTYNHNHTLISKIKFKRDLGELSAIRFGGEHQYYIFENDMYFVKTDTSQYFLASFVEADLYLSRKLVFRAGLRSEYDEMVDRGNVAPRASLAYKTGEESQISLAYGIFYQNPMYRYLYVNDINEYEKSTHYILNYQILGDNRTFRAETYYKIYDKLTLLEPNSLTKISLDGKGDAYGVDIFWRDKQSIPFVDYWISYSYLETKRKYMDYQEEVMPDFAANHTLTLVYKQLLPKLNSSLGATYIFASGRPYDDPNTAAFMDKMTKPYQNFSLSLSYLAQWWGSFTVIALSVDNVFGYKNIHGYHYNWNGSKRAAILDPAKRSFFIGIFMSFGRDNADDI
jgi:vitamin B12 transporter